RRVEENLHVEFLENKAIEQDAGPNWLFDIDSLTKSMNYVPVDAVLTACLNDSSKSSSEARLVSKGVANQEETPSLDNILSLTNRFEDILGVSTSSDEIIGVEADKTDPTLLQFCLFSCFLSQVVPKKVSDALQDPSWVEAMQEELLQFKI
nr:ribonuclease H-like domain, reverse transcriptase, RNA-dependent DNA polymerase [Tanacetum cinerariifolium]